MSVRKKTGGVLPVPEFGERLQNRNWGVILHLERDGKLKLRLVQSGVESSGSFK